MPVRNKRTELLAPAGSLASVIAAVNAGADAIYMGGRKFGARAFAESAMAEDEDMVLEAIRYCHLFGVRLYMTINILFKDTELPELRAYMEPYYKAGVDGLIVQDLGAARLLHAWFPDLEIHGSTQLTLTGVPGAKLIKSMGMCRAVLSRELSLAEIKKVHDEAGIELEVFIHGAMCYSYSGACFMSSLLGGRSGNRGRCAGTCRLCYETAGKKGYYLSMKDMQTIEMLPELIAAGAYSMKIEGRMKSPLYTAGVVSVYRKYLDLAMKDPEHYKVDPADLAVLREIYDRGGTTSYFKQHNGAGMIAVKEKPFRAVNEAVTGEIRRKYLDQNRTIPLNAEMFLTPGLPAKLVLKDADGLSVTCETEAPVELASSRPMSGRELAAQIGKTGGTAFTIKDTRVELNGEVFIPLSKINQLRRAALEQYTEAKLETTRRKQEPTKAE